MTLHTEWMRFQRDCCHGKGKAETANIKWVFYCGVLTSVNMVLDMQRKQQVAMSASALRSWEGVLKECAAFQKSVTKPNPKPKAKK